MLRWIAPRRGGWLRAARFVGLAALALGAAAGCGDAPRQGPPDLLLISVDTLRPDHLGPYGSTRDVTPHLDALARESIVFEQAIAHAPSTLPSHASILTSLHPSQHGALFSRGRGLRQELRTVTEVLREAGYRTGAFVGGGQVAPEFNLDQGFEVYESGGGSLRRQAREAADWLAGIPSGSPVFLFLHTYEVHHPYRPEPEHMDPLDQGYAGRLPDHIEVDLLKRINGLVPPHEEIDDADLQHVRNAYDAEIVHMDLGIRSLRRRLEDLGRWRHAAIVFTSDHGEEFGEHGRVGWHSHALWDHQLRVPLLLRLPDGRHRGTRVAAQVRGIDVAPTLVALAGLEAPAAFQGRSLLARLGPQADTDPWLARSERDQPADPLSTSVREGRWKWYDGRLYDLEVDPGETVDASGRAPDVAARLEAAYREALPEAGVTAGTATGPLGDAVEERLRALGYVE